MNAIMTSFDLKRCYFDMKIDQSNIHLNHHGRVFTISLIYNTFFHFYIQSGMYMNLILVYLVEMHINKKYLTMLIVP